MTPSIGTSVLLTVAGLMVVAPPSTVPPTAESTAESMAEPAACLAELSQQQKAALLVWPAVYAEDWDRARQLVGDLQVGGVLLMRPRLAADELRHRLDELDELSTLGVLVATDEEGGDVQRLVDIEPFPAQAEVSATMSPAEAGALVAHHARVVADVGVDVVLGPVVDVLPETGSPPLQRSRFFDGGPAEVTAFADAYVRAWQSAGLLPVLKHFPGHGSASADTHDAAGLTPDLTLLAERDLVPYRELAGSGVAVMVGHLTVPGLTGDRPASSSPAAIELLRGELGYADALVIADALDMAAAGGTVDTAAVASLAAGVDVVVFTSSDATAAVIDAVVAAVDAGQISVDHLDAAAGRVLDALAATGRGCP